MRRTFLLAIFGLLMAGVTSAAAQSQDTTSEGTSLGEIARKVREQRARNANASVKVYTNDDIPAGPAGVRTPSTTPKPAGPGAESSGRSVSAGPTGGESHDAAHYRQAMAKLRAKLDRDQRELAVLQQKLNLNQMQYYPDPNKTLRQEYSRSDINKLTEEVREKQNEIEADQKAISDLEIEVRRQGGDASWLQPGPGDTTGPETAKDLQIPTEPKKAQQYWRNKFNSAREALAIAQQDERLTEDELNLLKIRQAREMNNPGLGQQVAAKQREVESKRAATEKAQQVLDDLERELAATGAPKEWSE